MRESMIMDFLKKEWKAILFILWLIGITVYLFQMNDQIGQIKKVNTKMMSTMDSVESVAISTDSNIQEMNKKTDEINANVSFIVQKVRRK
jgi:hypothetical protein